MRDRRALSLASEAATARHRAPVHSHLVQFYRSEAYLAGAVSGFLAKGFRQGNPIIVIAARERHEAIANCLAARDIDVAPAISSKQFIQCDAYELLSSFMVSSMPDPDRFKATIGNIVDTAREGREDMSILAYGEMVDILWRRGQCEAAMRLEELWTEFISDLSIELFCAYAINAFRKENDRMGFEQICRAHSKVLPIEGYLELTEDERLIRIASLEQRSIALEAEVKHRKEVENALRQVLRERRDSENKLRQTERELRSFLQGAAEGLHWVGEDGLILWANQAELDLLGYSPDEYIGHNVREFHVDTDAIEDMLGRLSCGATISNREARLRHKDGSIRYVLINSNVLWDGGKFLHTQCFTRDITDLKFAEAVQPFYQSIVESADDAIVSKTLDGIVTSWNPGAERIFGYTAEEMIGSSILILIPTDRPDEESRILERLCRGERIDHFETQRVRKDGKTIDISLTVSPVKDRTGRIIGASKIARDITDKKLIEAELSNLLIKEQDARSEAESASRLKDDFLAVLSHELRTPLNAIIGWTSILASHDEKEMVRHAIDVIHRNALVQKRLIEDLLDMSRILTGKLVIRTDHVDLGAVLAAALDSIRPAASAKTISIDVQVDPGVPRVIGDADRLQQVVWNLLSNSVKFTPAGGTIMTHVSNTDGGVAIEVKDSGQGISPAFVPFVFDRFRQAEQGTARQHGGLGLGLAVVRHLVELHGGTVAADSPGQGLGSTFTVRLPLSEQKMAS
jgi:PAS domain S-box-containing protein